MENVRLIKEPHEPFRYSKGMKKHTKNIPCIGIKNSLPNVLKG